MVSYSKKTYEELLKEEQRLNQEYIDIETQSLKDNLSFSDFCEKAHDVKEKLFFVDKYIRLKKEPEITYGKEWNGELMDLDDFKRKSVSEYITDEEGIGYYATESSKSDIEVKPSDVGFNLLREDFTYVIWFNKQ